jgi:hypothetical protein
MISLRFIGRLVLLLLVLVALDAFALEAQAGLGTYFSGMATRSRVVQVCVATMALSLLIILKKFSPHDSHPRAFAPKMNYAPSVRRQGDKVTRRQADKLTS